MKARPIILSRCAFRPGRKRLEAFAFACIWDKHLIRSLHSQASCLTSSQCSQRTNQTHPGPCVLQQTLLFWDEGCLAMRNELLARVQGMMKSLVSAKLAQMEPLAPLELWRSPKALIRHHHHLQPPKCILRENVCLLGWHLSTQTAGSAKSMISRHEAWKDKQKLWDAGLGDFKTSSIIFWRIQFLLDFVWFSHQTDT